VAGDDSSRHVAPQPGSSSSRKWVVDGYAVDVTAVAHIFREDFAAADYLRSSDDRCIPIG
jgi:hypothetical protein